MAKNRKPVKPVEPDTESGDSSEPESDSQPDQTNMTQTPPPSQFASQPVPSSDEEESGSDSDPEKYSAGARKPKSILASAADPGKSSSRSGKPGSKPASAADPAKSGSRLRSKAVSAEEENGTDGKKKQTPNRVWSEEDVIVILKGMVDYAAKNNADPAVEFDAFIHSIKKGLHAEFTRRQLQDKIRKLKLKFNTSKKKGGEMIFPNPHDQMAYDLSKRIWGKKDDENVGGSEEVMVNAEANVQAVGGSKRKVMVNEAVGGSKRKVMVNAEANEDAVGGSKRKVMVNAEANEDAVGGSKRKVMVNADANKEAVVGSKRKVMVNAEATEEAVVGSKRKGMVNAEANEETVVRSKKKDGERAFPEAERAKKKKPVEELVLSEGDKLFGNGQEGDQWNELKLEEMETHLRHLEIKKKRLEIKKKQTKLVIKSLRSKLGGV